MYKIILIRIINKINHNNNQDRIIHNNNIINLIYKIINKDKHY